MRKKNEKEEWERERERRMRKKNEREREREEWERRMREREREWYIYREREKNEREGTVMMYRLRTWISHSMSRRRCIVSQFKSYIIELTPRCWTHLSFGWNVLSTTKDYTKRLHFHLAFSQFDGEARKPDCIVRYFLGSVCQWGWCFGFKITPDHFNWWRLC